MITATELAAMKPGAHLINAARGKCVDIDALAAAHKAVISWARRLTYSPKSQNQRMTNLNHRCAL